MGRQHMGSDPAEAATEDILENTKGMSDDMKEVVSKAAITICQLKQEGRFEEAEKLSKMVAESCGELAGQGEHSEMRDRIEELGESKGFLAKCLPMLENQLSLIQTRFGALPAEEQVKYVGILEKAVDMSKLMSELLKLAEE